MKNSVIIDGARFQSKNDFMKFFATRFGLSQESLHNWNAFWDEIAGIDRDVKLEFRNVEALRQLLGEENFRIFKEIMDDLKTLTSQGDFELEWPEQQFPPKKSS